MDATAILNGTWYEESFALFTAAANNITNCDLLTNTSAQRLASLAVADTVLVQDDSRTLESAEKHILADV